MKRLNPFFIFLCFSLVVSACEESDVGDICSLPDAMPAPTGETDSQKVVYPATERKDARCEFFSCISTQVRSDYCSRTCVSERDCPAGFACEALHPIGPLSLEKFCTLTKTCTPGVSNSCPQETMECKPVDTSDPEKKLYFCDQKKPGDKNAQ